jgi:hypothetical protein
LTRASIISIQTYTLTLHPQYRSANQAGQAAMIAPDPKASVKGRNPKSGSGGGVVSWFLFLLKVSNDRLQEMYG